MASWMEQIMQYQPACSQEEADKRAILQAVQCLGNRLLLRETLFAHFTSSAFIVNPRKNRALMVQHTLRRTWSWPGGHVDGDENFLEVAVKEAEEETGVRDLIPLSKKIVSLDIFPVMRHIKSEQLISPHLHFSVAYCFMCDDKQNIHHCPSENIAANWFPFSYITKEHFNEQDLRLYQKIIHHVLNWTSDI